MSGTSTSVKCVNLETWIYWILNNTVCLQSVHLLRLPQFILYQLLNSIICTIWKMYNFLYNLGCMCACETFLYFLPTLNFVYFPQNFMLTKKNRNVSHAHIQRMCVRANILCKCAKCTWMIHFFAHTHAQNFVRLNL